MRLRHRLHLILLQVEQVRSVDFEARRAASAAYGLMTAEAVVAFVDLVEILTFELLYLVQLIDIQTNRELLPLDGRLFAIVALGLADWRSWRDGI